MTPQVESLRGTGTSLTYDWIGRDLYWAESAAAGQYSSIHRRNLDRQLTERVAGQNGRIARIRVHPWTRSVAGRGGGDGVSGREGVSGVGCDVRLGCDVRRRISRKLLDVTSHVRLLTRSELTFDVRSGGFL